MEGQPPGARKGSRRAAPSRRPLDPRALGIAGGALLAAIAWAVLVYAGIRFGQSGRGGDSTAWVFMVIASLGAVACLFLALVLGARTAKLLGVGQGRPVRSVVARGGKRAAGKRVAPRR